MTTFVRTVLGDIAPSELGTTYAHEHVVLDSPLVEDRFADILLNDADAARVELAACAEAGVAAVIDALPCATGRHPERLAAISRDSGVHIIATTGLHTERWYPGFSWANDLDASTLAWMFVADIEEGIDRFDYRSPIIDRSPHRAGLIKAGTLQAELNDRDRRVFAGAAEAHAQTGAPILTHCEGGIGGMEQVEMLAALGVEPSSVVLSHTDKANDLAYHRDLVATGVYLEYDQALRHPLEPSNPTVQLTIAMVEEGSAGQLMLGTDGARPAMWTSFGGSPGLAALATRVVPMLAEGGLDAATIDRLLVGNPAVFFTFAEPSA